MSGALSTFVLPWLMWWLVLSAAYTAFLVTVDTATTAWQGYRDHRRRRLEDEAHVARDVASAVQRIGSAYHIAQRRIREEAAEYPLGAATNSVAQPQISRPNAPHEVNPPTTT